MNPYQTLEKPIIIEFQWDEQKTVKFTVYNTEYQTYYSEVGIYIIGQDELDAIRRGETSHRILEG